MTKHIGIVACSAEGAALCYTTICLEAAQKMGEQNHPEITMHTFSFADYMNAIGKGDWQEVARLMVSSTEKIQKTGADFAICPDNTIHQAYEFVKIGSPLPWLNIAKVVADKAKERGFRKLGILGTKYLMEGPVYPDVLDKYGINYLIPDRKDRNQVNTKIFAELVNGTLYADTHLYFNKVISGLKHKGCDAVVLGCTEIPLIISEDDSPLPILDSTRLLAQAAIDYSLK